MAACSCLPRGVRGVGWHPARLRVVGVLLGTVDKDGMAIAEGGDDLNEILVRVFDNIEVSAVGTDSEDALKNLFADSDPNSPKLGNTVIERNKKLVTPITKIAGLNFGGAFQDNSIDAFGDAYEFLNLLEIGSLPTRRGAYCMQQSLDRITLT